MEAPKRYLVDIEEAGGRVTSHAMKQWLREHPASLPKGMTTDNTSRELKRGLRNAGWRIQETDSEVHFFPPSTAPLSNAAAAIEDESEDDGSALDTEEILNSHWRSTFNSSSRGTCHHC